MPESPRSAAKQWLNTTKELLSDIQHQLSMCDADGRAWNLFTATADLVLNEMVAVKSEITDELSDLLNRVVPQIEMTLQALQARDRQAALTSLHDTLRILSPDDNVHALHF